MPSLRVWISINPLICTHLIVKVFESLGIEEIHVLESGLGIELNQTASAGKDDIMILSLNHNDRLENCWALEKLPNARVVAFSPKGEYAMVRSTELRGWEVVRPYGLQQLITEVCSVWGHEVSASPG